MSSGLLHPEAGSPRLDDGSPHSAGSLGEVSGAEGTATPTSHSAALQLALSALDDNDSVASPVLLSGPTTTDQDGPQMPPLVLSPPSNAARGSVTAPSPMSLSARPKLSIDTAADMDADVHVGTPLPPEHLTPRSVSRMLREETENNRARHRDRFFLESSYGDEEQEVVVEVGSASPRSPSDHATVEGDVGSLSVNVQDRLLSPRRDVTESPVTPATRNDASWRNAKPVDVSDSEADDMPAYMHDLTLVLLDPQFSRALEVTEQGDVVQAKMAEAKHRFETQMDPQIGLKLATLRGEHESERPSSAWLTHIETDTHLPFAAGSLSDAATHLHANKRAPPPSQRVQTPHDADDESDDWLGKSLTHSPRPVSHVKHKSALGPLPEEGDETTSDTQPAPEGRSEADILSIRTSSNGRTGRDMELLDWFYNRKAKATKWGAVLGGTFSTAGRIMPPKDYPKELPFHPPGGFYPPPLSNETLSCLSLKEMSRNSTKHVTAVPTIRFRQRAHVPPHSGRHAGVANALTISRRTRVEHLKDDPEPALAPSPHPQRAEATDGELGGHTRRRPRSRQSKGTALRPPARAYNPAFGHERTHRIAVQAISKASHSLAVSKNSKFLMRAGISSERGNSGSQPAGSALSRARSAGGTARNGVSHRPKGSFKTYNWKKKSTGERSRLLERPRQTYAHTPSFGEPETRPRLRATEPLPTLSTILHPREKYRGPGRYLVNYSALDKHQRTPFIAPPAAVTSVEEDHVTSTVGKAVVMSAKNSTQLTLLADPIVRTKVKKIITRTMGLRDGVTASDNSAELLLNDMMTGSSGGDNQEGYEATDGANGTLLSYVEGVVVRKESQEKRVLQSRRGTRYGKRGQSAARRTEGGPLTPHVPNVNIFKSTGRQRDYNKNSKFHKRDVARGTLDMGPGCYAPRTTKVVKSNYFSSVLSAESRSQLRSSPTRAAGQSSSPSANIDSTKTPVPPTKTSPSVLTSPASLPSLSSHSFELHGPEAKIRENWGFLVPRGGYTFSRAARFTSHEGATGGASIYKRVVGGSLADRGQGGRPAKGLPYEPFLGRPPNRYARLYNEMRLLAPPEDGRSLLPVPSQRSSPEQPRDAATTTADAASDVEGAPAASDVEGAPAPSPPTGPSPQVAAGRRRRRRRVPFNPEDYTPLARRKRLRAQKRDREARMRAAQRKARKVLHMRILYHQSLADQSQVAEQKALAERRFLAQRWRVLLAFASRLAHWTECFRVKRVYMILNRVRERAIRRIQALWHNYYRRVIIPRKRKAIMIIICAYRRYKIRKKRQAKRLAAKVIVNFLRTCESTEGYLQRACLVKGRRKNYQMNPMKEHKMVPSLTKKVGSSTVSQGQASSVGLAESLVSVQRPKMFIMVMRAFRRKVIVIQRFWRKYSSIRHLQLDLLVLQWNQVVFEQRQRAPNAAISPQPDSSKPTSVAPTPGPTDAPKGRSSRRMSIKQMQGRAPVRSSPRAGNAPNGNVPRRITPAVRGPSLSMLEKSNSRYLYEDDEELAEKVARTRGLDLYQRPVGDSKATPEGKDGALKAGEADAAEDLMVEPFDLPPPRYKLRLEKSFSFEEKRRILNRNLRRRKRIFIRQLMAYDKERQAFIYENTRGRLAAIRYLQDLDGGYKNPQELALEFESKHRKPHFPIILPENVMLALIAQAISHRWAQLKVKLRVREERIRAAASEAMGEQHSESDSVAGSDGVSSARGIDSLRMSLEDVDGDPLSPWGDSPMSGLRVDVQDDVMGDAEADRWVGSIIISPHPERGSRERSNEV